MFRTWEQAMYHANWGAKEKRRRVMVWKHKKTDFWTWCWADCPCHIYDRARGVV